MADRIQIRRDTDADWTSNDPTLAAGELGYVSDTDELVVGDGSTAYTSLSRLLVAGPRGVLGYAEVTADQTGITSETDLTGLSVTVDVESGRRIRVTGSVVFSLDTSNALVTTRIKESTTTLQNVTIDRRAKPTSNVLSTHERSVVLSPSSGSHTYKLSMQTNAGTVSSLASSEYPAFILVEDIGAA